jgi:hypothetical protein
MTRAYQSGLCTFSSLEHPEGPVTMSGFADTRWLSSGSSHSGVSIAAFSNDFRELVAEHGWVTKFYEQAASLNSVKALVPYYKEINGLIYKKICSL